MRRHAAALAVTLAAPAFLSLGGCRDLSNFSTGSGSFEGPVVTGAFVRAGFDAQTRMCLTLDANHFQDGPGLVSTDDGRFHAVPLRPIPQIWYDPLSTLTFGEGRLKNLLYVAAASTPFADGNGNDVFAVVSLMQSGDVEVRLLRSAPAIGAAASDASDANDASDASEAGSAPGPIFAIFALAHQKVPCSY